MGGDGLAAATRFLVLALCVLYALAVVAGPVLGDFDTRETVLWTVPLVVGAALLAIGQLLVPSGARSAALVSIGALVGGFPLFWTLIVPVAVATVVACSIQLARRRPASA
jgi:hypothetical protein